MQCKGIVKTSVDVKFLLAGMSKFVSEGQKFTAESKFCRLVSQNLLRIRKIVESNFLHSNKSTLEGSKSKFVRFKNVTTMSKNFQDSQKFFPECFVHLSSL